jgi:6-phospho-3-hexuloisomerase
VDYANLARSGGAPVFALTAAASSPVAKAANEVVLLKVPASKQGSRMAPLGTVFEEAALVYLDGLVAVLMERLGQDEEDMRRRHGVTR